MNDFITNNSLLHNKVLRSLIQRINIRFKYQARYIRARNTLNYLIKIQIISQDITISRMRQNMQSLTPQFYVSFVQRIPIIQVINQLLDRFKEGITIFKRIGFYQQCNRIVKMLNFGSAFRVWWLNCFPIHSFSIYDVVCFWFFFYFHGILFLVTSLDGVKRDIEIPSFVNGG